MKTTEQIFLDLMPKFGITTTVVSKTALKDLGSDFINRNLFFYLVMDKIMHDEENVSEKVESDCNPDAGKCGSWLEPEFGYCDDWIEFDKFGLSDIENKCIPMYYWDEEQQDHLEIELTDEHYLILRYFAEGWRDHLNEQARTWTGNPMRDCGHSYSDFI
jgi:hypothetical protein